MSSCISEKKRGKFTKNAKKNNQTCIFLQVSVHLVKHRQTYMKDRDALQTELLL